MRLAVRVLTFPGYSSLSPPTVRRVRCVSVLGGANAAGDASVCDFAILWHLKFGDEVYGVSAFWHVSADSLG